MTTVQQILTLFEERGDSDYGGEAVSQREHALQCAALAEQDGQPAALIAAALLHDIGHLLHDLPADAPDTGIDDHHENSGQRFLERCFGPDVTEPVRLHVAAKRYLCAVDPQYHEGLSGPSQVSLQLQGGPMNAEEVREFEAGAFARQAVRLRRWDDQAKVPGLTVPDLDHFARYLQESAAKGHGE